VERGTASQTRALQKLAAGYYVLVVCRSSPDPLSPRRLPVQRHDSVASLDVMSHHQANGKTEKRNRFMVFFYVVPEAVALGGELIPG
jgi:hypothetical protein